MPWVRLDDAFTEHPKIAAISDEALAMYVASLCYANRNLTDGFIPHFVGWGQLRYHERGPLDAILELEAAELWEKNDQGWMIHDYLDYNPSRERVRAEREQKRSAGQAGGRAAAKARAQAPAVAERVAERVAESKPVPVPVPNPQDQKKELAPLQKRDVLFEVVTATCGIDWRELEGRARGPINAAVASIRKVWRGPTDESATFAEVSRRAQNYRAHFGDAALTPNALAKHWAQIGQPPVRQDRSDEIHEWARRMEEMGK